MSASVALGGAGVCEAIPREYHRRVLKKIAQLTKVVYALNTRNEEHETLVAALRSTYEARAVQVESGTAARLREMNERVKCACDEAERRVEEVSKRLETERDEFKEKEVSCKRETEELLNAVRREHQQKVAGLVKELEVVSRRQAQQLRDVEHLRDEAQARLEQREGELVNRHKREMREAEQERKKQVNRCISEAALEKSKMEREMLELKEKHRLELEALRQSLEQERGAMESEKWKEREMNLQEEMRLKEQALAERVSGLSDELRTVKDQLVLSRQGVSEMTGQLKTVENQVCGMRCQLEEACRERGELRETLASLQTSLEAAEEDVRLLREKLSEKDEVASRAETGHREAVVGLKSQLMTLQERVRELEREKEALSIQHHSTLQKQSNSLSSVETELSRLRRERDELHLQYAREIEAVHAQVGAREAELSSEHGSQIQQLREQHERALTELSREHEKSLEQLRCGLSSAAELERESLCVRHEEERKALRDELAEKEALSAKLASELADALSAADVRGRGLGVVEGEVDKLKEEARRLTEREKAALREIEQLKEVVEKLKNEMIRSDERHRRELEDQRIQVQKDTRAECNKTMRCELEALRKELSLAHAQSTWQAQESLTLERDAALSEARHGCEREKSSLCDKIVVLEQRLVELQRSSTASLEEGREQAEKQITDLREALEHERKACAGHVADLERIHCEELERVRVEERERGRTEIQRLSEEWSREAKQREVRYSEEMMEAREEAEREKRETVSREQETHQYKMATLQCGLEERHRIEMERLKSEQEKERGGWQRDRQLLETQREKEVSDYRHQLEEVKREAERGSHELSHTRGSLHSLKEEAALLRKQLEVRSQELISTKRQADNILRCREQELSSRHHAEVEKMTSQYRQQTQLLLADFNKAKKMMSSKMAELQRKVMELESRYENRESRPEDLLRIRELEREVKHHQIKLKEIEMEKKVYQLELVNREKNYNQIFSANPCVGVLDPLAGSKKRSSKSGSPSSHHSSAPSLIPEERPRLPALTSSTSRLTSSDVELGGRSSQNRPRPHPTQSPLTRKTRGTVY